MKVSGTGLICAATVEELQTFGLADAEPVEPGKLWRIPEGYASVSGIGTPITLLRLLPWIQSLKPGWLVNLGIAGAYPGSDLKIGDVVMGTSEVFADLGMEMPDEEGFRPLSEFPFSEVALRSPMPLWVPEWADAKQGRGATINSCTGRDETGRMRRKLFGADFESMEGAAVALAGSGARITVCEVRAISNMASKRDVRPENILIALNSLRAFWETRRNKLP